MPLRYHVDQGRKLVVALARGKLTQQEVRAFIQRLVDDPQTDGCDELIVLRGVDLADFAWEDVRRVADYATRITPSDDFRTALVASADADFGLLRMFEGFRGRPESKIAVFRDVEGACKWLGVEPASGWFESD